MKEDCCIAETEWNRIQYFSYNKKQIRIFIKRISGLPCICVFVGVWTGLESVLEARERRSIAYFSCKRKRPYGVVATLMPKKKNERVENETKSYDLICQKAHLTCNSDFFLNLYLMLHIPMQKCSSWSRMWGGSWQAFPCSVENWQKHVFCNYLHTIVRLSRT